MEKNYFLCSESVVKYFPNEQKSKPFKSGYENDEENYYVMLLDFEEVKSIFSIFGTKEKSYFWCRECTLGSIDVSKITIKNCRKNGLFAEIENETNLTTERNIAICIYNLSQKYNCTPIEFINKIAK